MADRIRQEVRFDAAPERIYEALVDEKQHSAFTGAPAEISGEPGGAFSCYGAKVEGRSIELIPGRRIVQAWRVSDWEKGVYSLVSIELREQGEGTSLLLQQVGHPEGTTEHLEGGWHQMYWEPLRKHLGRA